MNKRTLAVLMALSTAFVSTGCSVFSDTTQQPHYAQKAITPLTELEYTNKINRVLMPLLADAQSFMGHHLDVVNGKFPLKEELVLVEQTLDKAQATINEVDGLYQPSTYTEHKMQTLMNLSSYKDALKRYKEALEAGDKEKIKTAGDGLKVAFTTLKSKFGAAK